jgi:hypothetical protein
VILNKLANIKNSLQLVNNSSYRGEDKEICDPNSVRAGPSNTSNQIAILMRKRKDRMVNAANSVSLSRFSQPNDSDSSFKNAYEEYQYDKVNKTNRMESPIKKLDSNNFNAFLSRNITSEVIISSKKYNKNVILKDQKHKNSVSTIKNPEAFSPLKYSEIRNMQNHLVLDSNHKSFSMIVTNGELEKKRNVYLPPSGVVKGANAGELYNLPKHSEKNVYEHRTSLPPLKPAQYQNNVKDNIDASDNSSEEKESDTKDETLEGFGLNISKNTDQKSVGSTSFQTHVKKISKNKQLNDMKIQGPPVNAKRNFFYIPDNPNEIRNPSYTMSKK